MRQICRTAGLGFFGKFAVEISLISVAVAGTGFITEAMLAVEYIQATRLALIQAHPVVSFVLVSMSLVKCKLAKDDSILEIIFLSISFSISIIQYFYYGSNGCFGFGAGRKFFMSISTTYS